MLEKLADALAAANDWPAACDSLVQLRKTGMLSRHAQQLWQILSEDSAQDAAQTESDSSYSARLFKRRKVDRTPSERDTSGPAELILPAHDWPQLLSNLAQHLQMHHASGNSTRYNIHLSSVPAGTALGVPEEAQHLESAGPASLPADTSSARPLSATSLPPDEEDLVQQSAETASQDCSERVSKRIASRRYAQRASKHQMPCCYCSQPWLSSSCSCCCIKQLEVMLHPVHEQTYVTSKRF